MNTAMKKPVWNLLLVVPLLLIVIWRSGYQPQQIEITDIPEPPARELIELLGAGDEAWLARMIIIWLQQYDTQAGQYVAYNKLNYKALEHWLDALVRLDPESEYAMLLATRIYTKVADPERKRRMLEFVYQQFLQEPEKNWRWLAEAVVQAKYKLKDLQLALRYATALAESEAANIPQWARDSRLHVLQQRGEIEQLRLIIGGMLAEGKITDPNEIKYLDNYLKKLEKDVKTDAK